MVGIFAISRCDAIMRDLIAEASGFDGDPAALDARPFSDCTRDSCVARIRRGSHDWIVLATRSANRIDWETIARACAQADIAVSDRRLPRGCVPRWLKLDRAELSRTGGVAIFLGNQPRVGTVAERVAAHPWSYSGTAVQTASSVPAGSMK